LVETAQRKYAYYLGPKKGWAIQDSEVALKDCSSKTPIIESKGELCYEYARIEDKPESKDADEFPHIVKSKEDLKENFEYCKFADHGAYCTIYSPPFKSSIDFESVPILRDNKISFYENLIVEAVDFKYKISYYKGVQLVFETIVLLILMSSIVLKSNLISLVYLCFIVKYLVSKSKTKLIIHMVYFISIAFSL